MNNNHHQIAIVPNNASKSETIIQIADSLKHLSKVTDDIANRINNRINTNTAKLNDITSRIEVVTSKINSLKGAKCATQVFSASKYPAAEVNRPYVSIFENLQGMHIERTKVTHKTVVKKDEPVEKLHIYHVKLRTIAENTRPVGLGDIPREVEGVNDLLLYNSGKNIYKKFVISDTLEVAAPKNREEAKESIAAAPASILDRTMPPDVENDGYFYAPHLGEVPTLDVPLDLPDLPGIADGLRYDLDLGPTIAPSISSYNTSISEKMSSTTIEEANLMSTSYEDLPMPPLVFEEEVTESRTPEQPPEIKTEEIVPPKSPQKSTPEKENLPTPPNEKIETSANISRIPENDGRNSLMDAIRKAGGAKNLKSVKKDIEKPKLLAGGDHMAELHNKLAMRRKGISGAKALNSEEPQFDLTTTLSKISSMIPPPSGGGQSDVNTSNTEDEDWD